MTWGLVVDALLGVWFIASPFVLRFNAQRSPMVLSIIGGGILVLLSLWQLGVEDGRSRAWADYVNALVGLWLIALPFVYRLQTVPHLLWTSVVGGALVVLLSAYLASRATAQTGTPREAHT